MRLSITLEASDTHVSAHTEFEGKLFRRGPIKIIQTQAIASTALKRELAYRGGQLVKELIAEIHHWKAHQ